MLKTGLASDHAKIVVHSRRSPLNWAVTQNPQPRPHIGIVEDDPGTPERFFRAAESTAVVPVPSLTSSEAFDSGVLFEAGVAERLIDHARQVYAGARKVEAAHTLRELPTMRS